jgi:hypothetical protein
MANIREAYELVAADAVIIKQAVTQDGRGFEALICYDRLHAGVANCLLLFPSVLTLVLSEAS